MFAVVFILFLLIYIQGPGLLILNIGESEEELTAEYVLHAFFLGLGILILEYYIFSSLKLWLIFVLFNPVISLVLLFRNNKTKLRTGILTARIKEYAAVFIIIVINTCITQWYSFINLDNVLAVFMNQDITWHIGNVAQLSRGLPFADYRFAGLGFNYHYFNDLIFGMCKYISGMNAQELYLKGTLLLTVYVFSLGMIAFFGRFKPGSALTGLILFICCGTDLPGVILNGDNGYPLINYHIFSNINGVAISLGSLISVFLWYSRIYKKDGLRADHLAVLAILVFVMTGLKGPFAAVLVAAMLIASLLKALEERGLRKLVIVSAVISVSFLSTYFFVIKGYENLFKTSNNNRAVYLSITGTMSRSVMWNSLGELFHSGHVLLYCLCVVIIGSVVAAGVFYLFFMARTFYLLLELFKYRLLPSAETITSIMTGWIGLAGFWLVSQNGFSQVYFLFAGLPFIVGEGVAFVCSVKKTGCRKCATAVILVNIVAACIIYSVAIYGRILNDAANFYINKSADNSEMLFVLTRDEMDGLEWLRKNTDKSSVIATNRLQLWSNETPPDSDSDCRCFYYSAFAERQMFIEGFSYSDISADEIDRRLEENHKVYSDDPNASGAAIRSGDIDYVIVSKRFGKVPEGFSDPVFSNNGMAIFKCWE